MEALPCRFSLWPRSSPLIVAKPVTSFRPLVRSRWPLIRANDSSSQTLPLPQEQDQTEPSSSSSSPLPAPKKPSLISLPNIQKAFRGEGITNVDHYARLGVGRSASYSKVAQAFRDKCEELAQGSMDEEAARIQLQLLKESFDILASKEQRRLLDWSLAVSENTADTYIWPYEVDITQKYTGPPFPKRPKDEEGIQRYTYFFLGWLLLSFVLNVVLQ